MIICRSGEIQYANTKSICVNKHLSLLLLLLPSASHHEASYPDKVPMILATSLPLCLSLVVLTPRRSSLSHQSLPLLLLLLLLPDCCLQP